MPLIRLCFINIDVCDATSTSFVNLALLSKWNISNCQRMKHNKHFYEIKPSQLNQNFWTTPQEIVVNKPIGRISKRVFQEKKSTPHFPKNKHFLSPDTHTYVWGKKCSFFEKFGVLCFLETPVLRFALLPTKYKLRNGMCNCFDCKIDTSQSAVTCSKFNNRNTRTRCEICSELTIKIPQRRQWCHSSFWCLNF